MSMIDKAIWQSMVDAALKARDNAYVPVSNYRVGAAIVSASGQIYAGCNIEDAAFNSSIHAEQNAIAHMRVAEGAAAQIVAVAVIAESVRDPMASGMPCGHCRQFMGEFIAPDADITIRSYNNAGQQTGESTLRALLPQAFSGRDFLS